MFPIIPLLALLAIGGGVATLAWYSGLSREQQIAADKRMNQLALQWFSKRLNQLNEQQRAKVERQVEKEFLNRG